MKRFVVLDFETTGLSAVGGDRVIEVGAVELIDGRIGTTFHSLVNPCMTVPASVTDITGISNAMVRAAPVSDSVMPRLNTFLDEAVVVAHNAQFDRGFYRLEMGRCKLPNEASFLCTLRIARRVYVRASDYGLKKPATYADIPLARVFHRALADALLTARLFLALCADIRARHRMTELPLDMLRRLQRVPVATSHDSLEKKAVALRR
jgi:DNA polymerase-3 subunit epsilon